MKTVIFKIAAVAFVAFMAAIIYSADTGFGLPFWQFIYHVPGADKLGHLVLYSTLAFLVNAATRAAEFRVGTWRILKGSFFIMVATVLEEFSQIYIPGRSFDLWDLAVDGVAILSGGWLARRVVRQPNGTDP